MTRSQATLVWAPLAVLVGCTPLNQAALVYSSAVQVGVNVNVATPQNPGLQISLGVNALDAAYVPVAVGGACAQNDHDPQCAPQIIRASANVDSVSGDPPDRAPDLAIDDPAADPGAGGSKAARPLVQDDPGPTASTPDQVTPQAVAQAINREIKELSLNDHTNDAMSVFGTFNSNGTANVPTPTAPATGSGATAGLLFGRSFSTGVASQHLTRGIRDATRADALARCISAATAAVNGISVPADKEKRLQELLAACAAGSR